MITNNYVLRIICFCILSFNVCLNSYGSSPIRVEVPLESNLHQLLGVGVEFPPFFHSINVPRGEGARTEDWIKVVVPRVKSMKIQRYRVGVFPEWWELYNDNDDSDVINDKGFVWNGIEMSSLYKVLDLAEQTGADVSLVFWGCLTNTGILTGGKNIKYIGRHFLADLRNNWITGPYDTKEFAENITALLYHLIVKRSYTCIKEITPFNEPDGNVVGVDRYIECVKALDNYLKIYKLRDKVKIVASDNMGNSFNYLSKCVEGLDNIADIFCSHVYSFGYGSRNSDIVNWEKKNLGFVSPSGRPHIIGEFGSDQCVGASRQTDIDLYERGVLLCRLVIDYLNAGAVSVSYWNLFDHYRNLNTTYEGMQQLGLWKYINSVYESEEYYNPKTRDYEARPHYYAYSLLTRFIRKGDKAFPLTIDKDYFSGIALQHEDGSWTYIFANEEHNDYDVDLKSYHNEKKRFGVYKYMEEKLPKNARQIRRSSKMKVKNDSFMITVPSNSVLVLSQ